MNWKDRRRENWKGTGNDMNNLLEGKPEEIPAVSLHSFEGHPYKVLDDEEMDALTESILEHGIISPLIVRPKENATGEYEIVSGHRRFRAAQKAGLETVPAFILPITREEAAVILVDSNLHREHLLPSEKAFAYKLKADAMKHQGKHIEQSLGQFVPKTDQNRTTGMIGESAGESYKTVQRYIRLTRLVPELLQWVDEGKVAFSVGAELSYLDSGLQRNVVENCEYFDCTPSYAQSVQMHRMYNSGSLDAYRIYDILSQEKGNQNEKIKISQEKLRGKIPQNLTDLQLEEFIAKACDFYSRYLLKKKEKER